jgi:hypothetical protein
MHFAARVLADDFVAVIDDIEDFFAHPNRIL